MPQAIVTKTLPVTTYLPTRIKAEHQGKTQHVVRSTYSIPEDLDDEQQHRYVANELLEALGWHQQSVPLVLVKGGAWQTGYVYVPVARTSLEQSRDAKARKLRDGSYRLDPFPVTFTGSVDEMIAHIDEHGEWLDDHIVDPSPFPQPQEQHNG